MEHATAESLLISALINSGDTDAARRHGLTPNHMVGYRTEYNWLLNYPKTYGTQPTWEIFSSEFPDFPRFEHTDVRSAVDQVFKAYGRRNLTEAMQQAMEHLGDGDLSLAYETVRAAEPKRTHLKPKNTLASKESIFDWERPRVTIEVPYRTLQHATGGMREGNLWYLAARPGQGKSAHLVNMVTDAVLAGNRVRFFSLEMSEEEVRSRFHAQMANRWGFKDITLTALRERAITRRRYEEFIDVVAQKLEGSGGAVDILTSAEGKVSPGVVAAGADEYNLSVVDYVGLMRAESGSRVIEDWHLAAANSNALKETAIASHSAILAASQINREGERGEDAPKLVNLAQSDALGQDGDVVITLRQKAHGSATVFSLEKNRHGPSGLKWYSYFDPDRGVFDEITEETAETLAIDMEIMASDNVIPMGVRS